MPWETTLASAFKALKVLEKLDFSRRIDRVRIDNSLQTLRQIFFYSPELIAALEDIEAGKPIETEVIEYFIEAYGSVPDYIQRSLSFIDNDKFEDRNVLLIEEIELMTQIRYGKINTRRDICNFSRRYQTEIERGSNHLSMDAARVLGQIGRFNTQVKKLEAKLLSAHRRDSGIATPRRRT